MIASSLAAAEGIHSYAVVAAGSSELAISAVIKQTLQKFQEILGTDGTNSRGQMSAPRVKTCPTFYWTNKTEAEETHGKVPPAINWLSVRLVREPPEVRTPGRLIF